MVMGYISHFMKYIILGLCNYACGHKTPWMVYGLRERLQADDGKIVIGFQLRNRLHLPCPRLGESPPKFAMILIPLLASFFRSKKLLVHLARRCVRRQKERVCSRTGLSKHWSARPVSLKHGSSILWTITMYAARAGSSGTSRPRLIYL